MECIKILQLNTTSFNTSKKALSHYCKQFQPNIICLQETDIKTEKIKFENWKGRNWTIFPNKTTGLGVSTMIQQDTKGAFRKDLDNANIEGLWTEIEYGKESILIGNVYIPPKDHNQLELLDNHIANIKHSKLILLGDFNSKNKLWDDNAKYNNRMGKKLEEILTENDLNLCNTGATTCQTPNGSSAVDITATRGLPPATWSITPLSLIKTFHHGILITIPITDGRLPTPHKPLRFKTRNADWNEWKNQTDLQMHELPLPNNSVNPETDIDNRVKNLTTYITNSAEKVFGRQNICNKSKIWWSPKVTAAMKEQRKSRNKFQRHQTPHNKAQLQMATEHLQNTIDAAKKETKNYQLDQINKVKTSQEVWHRINKMLGNKQSSLVEPLQKQSDPGDYEFDDENISNRLAATHIHRIGTDESNFDNDFKLHVEKEVEEAISNSRQSTHNLKENAPFTMFELKAAIKKMNAASSPGPDSITMPLISNAGPLLLQHLLSIYNDGYNHGYFPKPWKVDNKIYIKKKPKRALPHRKSISATEPIQHT